MARLQLFRPGAIIELVPYTVPSGVSADGIKIMCAVPDTWAMPGGGTKTTAEVLQLAEDASLLTNLVR